MPSTRAKLKLATPAAIELRAQPLGSVGSGTVVGIQSDGLIDVLCADGGTYACAWLENGENQQVRLAVGDAVLLALAAEDAPPIVIGRIGRYSASKPAAQVKIEATESLTLICGAGSVALRADGKVMICGEDVLVRAKGTKRIRAGTVAIN